MVDNRSAGFFGIGGAFNFKSGDISGTAAKKKKKKYGPGSEYGIIYQGDEEEPQSANEPYTDRSAQLKATLNSLAMMNVAAVINSKKPKKHEQLNFNDLENETEEIIKENSKHAQSNNQEENNTNDDDDNLLDNDEQNIDLFPDDTEYFDEDKV